MSNDPTSPISVPQADNRRRRGSIADIFSKPSNPPNAQSANQQSNQRRLSITTLGLSGSPTQTSPFSGNRNFRRGSLSSSMGSNVPAEDALEEEQATGTSPNSQFGRRVSFGAQALRDARAGSIGNGRNYPPPSAVSQPRSPPAGSAILTTRSSASTSTSPQNERSNASRRPLGEGFNWSEALRSRAERAPSLGGPVSPQAAQRSSGHQRAASIASMEQPSREMPRQPKQNKPDFFQEKILRGDFMD
ncbi:hypothetical protein E8E15_007279 [Penicillium rubens]|jgi:hypothetical protein|uniref:Pc20g09110 protein n=2 Tax=Penicillium chrysogenum species complex TaxID=254878 RepID=B6HF14_PENRW|nr:uncharacterized protein N7525_009310 [Penicillium rubens]XP_056572967.1 uncharacterized protein N7489_002910 [Penicillium chrysogenum]CAP86240.1 Pc20g09110 [Penicillium rubens Wisconsin 54-1255]KAF3017019.1 hypothetical protein E8E15_007279 [Penicillium rubens]KAJ5053545.1 hypothetical protein NUH16_010618 [Penicillium rubens]KAJ5252500.1 hypothetical protein N7489_002910 [Penicillium chrysogenum]KAJ5254351.1 hypothetical protein N7524_011531 [Penicillium chrysogenum]